MVITIDEYFESEGIKEALNYDDALEKVYIERFGKDYQKESDKIMNHLFNSPDKDAVLALYNHFAKYNIMEVIITSNFAKNKHNIPLVNSKLEKAEEVLDLGCSDCFKTIFYALNYPDKDFTGVDMNSKSLELAEQKIKKYDVKNIELICKDVYDLPEFQKQFDHILTVDMLHETQIPRMGWSMYGNEWSMDFWNKLESIEPVLKAPGYLILSLNYCGKDHEDFIFNNELNPAAEDVGLELISRECRFFKKGGGKEYNGLYHYFKNPKRKYLTHNALSASAP